jgi:pimeloyl-ACP methyl ester carboxylesterase
VIFVIHGILGNAKDYLSAWKRHARAHNIMVVCPAFVGYRINTSQSHQVFMSVEAIFKTMQAAGLARNGYHLYGHSAGAQFTHRAVLFLPKDSCLVSAVAANSGWYTMPTVNGGFPYPYSMTAAPVGYTEEELRVAFSRRLLVVLGQNDVGSKYVGVKGLGVVGSLCLACVCVCVCQYDPTRWLCLPLYVFPSLLPFSHTPFSFFLSSTGSCGIQRHHEHKGTLGLIAA